MAMMTTMTATTMMMMAMMMANLKMLMVQIMNVRMMIMLNITLRTLTRHIEPDRPFLFFSFVYYSREAAGAWGMVVAHGLAMALTVMDLRLWGAQRSPGGGALGYLGRP